MTVDVILPVYCGKRWICEAIDSVLAQTYSKWHLTIVDDGSPDDTLDYVIGKYGTPGSKISFLRVAHRAGPGRARMEAIRKTHGDVIAFIDQDDRWYPEKLACQIERLRATPITQCVHTDVRHIDGNGRKIRGSSKWENRVRAATCYDRLDAKRLTKHLFLHHNTVRLVSALVLRHAFEKTGGFDETLAGAEDWEFWIRFAASGNRMAHIAKPLVERRVHGRNASHQARWRHAHWQATDKLLRIYPELNEFAERRMANLRCEETMAALVEARYRDGRRQALQLICFAPSDWRGYVLLLFSWLGRIPRSLLLRRIA
jgi:glycosyltransferase involved in cell wall biosynthesis